MTRKRTASKVALTDNDHKEFATDHAKYKLQMSAADRARDFAVKDTWADIAAFVKLYDSIDQLVMFYHGVPGQIEVHQTFTSLSDRTVLSNFTAPLPTIKEINFEACNVGNKIADMIPFGKALGVSKMTAFTFFWVTSNKIVNVTGFTGAQIGAAFADDAGYVLPYDWNDVVKTPGDHKIWEEWFRANFNNDPLPPKGAPGSLNQRFLFKQRSSATDRTVAASSVTPPPSGAMSAPATSFERIILTF